jgi:hypothetical protein
LRASGRLPVRRFGALQALTTDAAAFARLRPDRAARPPAQATRLLALPLHFEPHRMDQVPTDKSARAALRRYAC